MHLSPESPISLDEAAEICLRGLVKASTLRAAADRGELEVERLGKRLVTTPADVDEWRRKCRAKEKERASICAVKEGIRSARLRTSQDGSSSMEEENIALDAALMRVRKLKGNSESTSVKSGNRNGKNVIFLKS